MRQAIPIFAVLVAVVVAAAPAKAKRGRSHKYLSRHPLKVGFCVTDGPHMHDFAPPEARIYRTIGDGYYFVGDPVAFGYEGPRHAYYGEHPVFDTQVNFGEPTYCYLEGAHYHWYGPPAHAQFEVRAGVAWFVGSFDPLFWTHRPRYMTVNQVHRPIQYVRPTAMITDAPRGWRRVPRGHAKKQVVVAAPLHRSRPAAISGPVWMATPPSHGHVEVRGKDNRGHGHGQEKHKNKGKGRGN